MFSNLFNTDNVFWRMMSRFADLFYLNLLCIFFSLPIFTIGASVTAMYTVTLKWVNEETPYLFPTFWDAFKSNFKKSTIMWLIMLAVGAFVIVDISLTQSLNLPMMNILFYIFLVFGVIYLMILSYVFPLLSKFENTIFNTIKNAALMSIVHMIPWTPLLVIVNFVPYAIFFLSPDIFLLLISPILLVCGFAAIAYINSMMFKRIFNFYVIPEEYTDIDETESTEDSDQLADDTTERL